MTSDEEKVRAVYTAELWHSANGDWYVDLLYTGNDKHGAYSIPGSTLAGAWSAAWAFTEHRLEEIRQVREEVALIGEQLIGVRNWLAVLLVDGMIAEASIRLTRWSRILAREQAHLATLCAGMKATQDGAAAREGNGG